MKHRSQSILTLLFVAVLCAFTIHSCNHPGSGKVLDEEIIHAEKPSIDSSMVLETLELYRAKRYEGIQEAMGAGVENVYKLVLHGKSMGTLSPDIGRLTFLHSLDVSKNKLTLLPGEIMKMDQLTRLSMDKNTLTSIPVQLFNLSKLKNLPKEIITLSESLGEMNIQGNQIPREEIEWLIEAMPATKIRY